MLKNILSPKTCSNCRICCKFDYTDTWELPVLSMETKMAVTKNKPETQFTPIGEEVTFKTPMLSGDELFSCPALTDSGCGLSEKYKPFDCKIWPFRIMYDEDKNKIITVSELCPAIKNLSDNQLRKFLIEESLAKIIFDYSKCHPSHIKPMQKGYRPLLKEI